MLINCPNINLNGYLYVKEPTERLTSLDIALDKSNDDIAGLLIEREADVDTEMLHLVLEKGMNKTARLLIDHKDINMVQE